MHVKPLWTYFFLGLFIAVPMGCGDSDDDDDSNKDSASDNDSDTGANSTENEDTTDVPEIVCDDVGTGGNTFRTAYGAATIPVEGSDKTYIIHTNWWYEYDGQTVTYDGLSFTVGNPNGVDVGSVGAPAGYPSIYIGSYSGRRSAESNLPILVSDIESVPTIFETNGTEGGIDNKNAAYDVWFTASGDPLPNNQYTPGAGGAFLMVWTFDPPDRQPRGAISSPEHAVDGVEGAWDVWVDPSNPPCISYVSTTPVDDLAFDLNKFIRDSIDNEFGITDEMYLSVIFGGFEIWGGGDGLALERFCAEVN